MEVIFKYIGYLLKFVFLGIIGVGVFFFYIVRRFLRGRKCWRLKRMIGGK